MILLDTNIIVALLRSNEAKVVSVLRTNQAGICGVTIAELLHGVRTIAERRQFEIATAPLVQVPIDDSLWGKVGENLSALRANGFTVPFQDAVIATVAIDADLELWTRDKHFKLILGILSDLRLYPEQT